MPERSTRVAALVPMSSGMIRRSFPGGLDGLSDLIHVDGVAVCDLALGGDFVPPAPDAEADHAQEHDGQNDFSSCSHRL